jgi:hypothetical protein
VATLLVALGIFVAGILTAGHEALAELVAVAPGGWSRYQTLPDGRSETLPVVLLDSDTPNGVVEVSYPDAAMLPFHGQPVSGQGVGLIRQLDDLEIGETYRFYLQVFDPAGSGDPTETLTVWLDDQVVWQRGPLAGCTPATPYPVTTAVPTGDAAADPCLPRWHYVTVLGVATADRVTIRVDRIAGSNPHAAAAGVPAVRSLHLYPKY